MKKSPLLTVRRVCVAILYISVGHTELLLKRLYANKCEFSGRGLTVIINYTTKHTRDLAATTFDPYAKARVREK